MSDSSEEEDLSKFQEAVDTSFTRLINECRGVSQKDEKNLPSERYLETSSHYNDVCVPERMQNQIGAKISKVIENKYEFVDMDMNTVKKRKIKGGVRLFSSSTDYLSPDTAQDTYTAAHNIQSKQFKLKRWQIDEVPMTENDKINAVTVSGDHILSKEETKCWKSRRKEKLFKYKSQKNSKILNAVE